MNARLTYLKTNVTEIKTSHDAHAKHREPKDIIDHFATTADPSKTKMYTQWIINMYNKGMFRQEDSARILEVLGNFSKYKRKLPEEQRDINQYETVSSVQKVVEPYLGLASTRREEYEMLKANRDLLNIPGEHELLFRDDVIEVYALLIEAASKKFYASKTAKKPGVFPTEWCTAFTDDRECYFSRYTEDGNRLFVVHRLEDDSVAQYDSSSFMDSDDESIDPKGEFFLSIRDSLWNAWDDPKLGVKRVYDDEPVTA